MIRYHRIQRGFDLEIIIKKRDDVKMEYRFTRVSAYTLNGDIYISLNEYGSLTESERNFILSDILEHEHIHDAIRKFFTYEISAKFDSISHLLNKENNNKYQKLAHCNNLTTWDDVSQRRILLDIKDNRKV